MKQLKGEMTMMKVSDASFPSLFLVLTQEGRRRLQEKMGEEERQQEDCKDTETEYVMN